MNKHSVRASFFFLFAFSILFPGTAQEVFFFRDSNNPGYYDTGLAFKTTPSTIEQTGSSGDKIPTTPTAFYGSNSLRLTWNSKTGGDWSALVIAPGWPFQNISNTDTLSFWAYAPDGLSQSHWPVLFLEGAPGATKSRKYPISAHAGDLPAKVWTLVKIPLHTFFTDPNQTNIQFTQIKAVIFGQGLADGQPHTLLIDEVKTYRITPSGNAITAPSTLTATGYDRHIELRWPSPVSAPYLWRIYRSADDGQTFTPIRNISGSDSLFIDFHKTAPTQAFRYYVTATNSSGIESAPSPTATAALVPMSDDALLNMVQQYSFRYFWDFAHPVSGMARERNTSGNLVTIGGTGFGVMAILVAVERGWITRAQGLQRLTTIVNFLSKANRFKGIFPHWMDGTTGSVIPFSPKDNGGDLVESAFLFQGLLTVRAYFDQEATAEKELRDQITTLWQQADWNWYRQNQGVVYWHWSPTEQFALNHQVRGWNETMIVYLLGIASPSFPLPASLWQTGWANNGGMRNGNSFYGIKLPLGGNLGGPLFFAHYSFMGFDPRGIKDQYANYFEQNRNQSLINRAYCIINPKKFPGYGANSWGLTASDDPLVGYLAHEPYYFQDNGTMAPTGALSSMPYTPQESTDALKYFYRELGESLWGPMGFYDAFNLQEKWFANSYLAIDQGPIVGMIENHRSGLLWKYFMKNQEIQDALTKIGFTQVATPVHQIPAQDPFRLRLHPNPVVSDAQLQFHLTETERVDISLYDLQGRLVQSLLSAVVYPAGLHQLQLSLANIQAGSYTLHFKTATQHHALALILQP